MEKPNTSRRNSGWWSVKAKYPKVPKALVPMSAHTGPLLASFSHADFLKDVPLMLIFVPWCWKYLQHRTETNT
ncbi:hypothetical protein E2C01_023200 [Portunus trituberculatus]|uniref:Uncharacterized protein n=1 Tax=Portunus trituberculatus TaxID=210409 RepID=A0A5B7E9B9_PORTR|nr:hypothetical protein [Portunus trituberculatus]